MAATAATATTHSNTYWRMRGEGHPAWVLGALWIVAGQVIASLLFYNPAWKALAASILTSW